MCHLQALGQALHVPLATGGFAARAEAAKQAAAGKESPREPNFRPRGSEDPLFLSCPFSAFSLSFFWGGGGGHVCVCVCVCALGVDSFSIIFNDIVLFGRRMPGKNGEGVPLEYPNFRPYGRKIRCFLLGGGMCVCVCAQQNPPKKEHDKTMVVFLLDFLLPNPKKRLPKKTDPYEGSHGYTEACEVLTP